MIHTLLITLIVLSMTMTAQAQSTTQPSAKRTVLITGANRGIGLEFAKQYHAAGWSVIGTARDPEKATDLKAIGDDVRILTLDVTNTDSIATMAKTLDGQPIDLLINNAGLGITYQETQSLKRTKMDDVEKVLQVNLIGPMRVTQALLPNVRAGKGRTIVSITSGLGSIEQNDQGAFYGYRESKAGLNMFMRSLAAETKGSNFICIVMDPGWVQTDMGGRGAELTPEQSISGMRKVIDGLKPEDTGKFWRYDGTNPPW